MIPGRDGCAMNAKRISISVVCTLWVAASVAWAQNMVDAAAVAGGSSIGAAAGKKVSDGINSVFGKTGKVLEKSSQTGEHRDTSLPRFFPTSGPAKKPANAAAAANSRPHKAHAESSATAPTEAVDLATSHPPAAAPPPRTPSADDVRGIQGGTEREVVVARLGRPAASIFIPEDGGREILQYRTRGELVGTVRLNEGVVSNVQVR